MRFGQGQFRGKDMENGGNNKTQTWRKGVAAPVVANHVVYFTTWQYTGLGGLWSRDREALRFDFDEKDECGGLAALFYDLNGEEI